VFAGGKVNSETCVMSRPSSPRRAAASKLLLQQTYEQQQHKEHAHRMKSGSFMIAHTSGESLHAAVEAVAAVAAVAAAVTKFDRHAALRRIMVSSSTQAKASTLAWHD
jgi:hypothetical protein